MWCTSSYFECQVISWNFSGINIALIYYYKQEKNDIKKCIIHKLERFWFNGHFIVISNFFLYLEFAVNMYTFYARMKISKLTWHLNGPKIRVSSIAQPSLRIIQSMNE